MAVNPLQKMVQSQAYHILMWQMIGVILLSAATWPLAGRTQAVSVLAGGCVVCLPNLLFVWRVFRFAGAQQMTQFMVAFLIGEMLKLFLSGILFLLVVKYLPVSLLSVLVGFAGAIILFWIVSFWRFTRQDTRRINNSI